MRFSSSGKHFTVKTTSPKQWFPAQILLNTTLFKNDPKVKIIKYAHFIHFPISSQYFPSAIHLKRKFKRECYSCSGPEVSLASHLPSSLVTEILFPLEQSLVQIRIDEWERVGFLKGHRRGWLSLGLHNLPLLLALMPKYMIAAILNHKANLKIETIQIINSSREK